METKDTLQIVKVLTFFVIMMFLNYVFGNLFDLKIVQYFNIHYKSAFDGDPQSMKLISLLFFGLYVFAYSTVVAWLLKRFFSVSKGFILVHINALILLLLVSGITWINGLSITYPGNYIDAMPIISVAILVVTGILSGKIEFFDPNADDSTGLFESIRKDVSSTNGEVKGFLSSIKSSFERSKNEEDTRFNDFGSNEGKSNEPNLRDKFKGGIDFDNDDFGVKPRVDGDNSIRPGIRETFGNDNNEGYIDIPDNNDKKDADFDIRPKDIKGLLRENRDRLSNPQEDIGNDSRKNPFDELSDLNDLSDDSTIRIDESEMPTNDDGYIEITEQEEDDQEIPMDNIDTFESEKPGNLSDSISIVSDVKDNVEKNDFNDNGKKEINFDIYYAVGYNTNSEQVLLDELIKKL